MSTLWTLSRDWTGEYVAKTDITQDEAEFLADLLAEHCPEDAAASEWRQLADRLAAMNGEAW